MNVTYYDTPIIKRAYELQPGDIIGVATVKYKVLEISRRIRCKSLRCKEMGSNPHYIGAKSQERVKVIGFWPVAIQNSKRKEY